jgi:hypothetical protein
MPDPGSTAAAAAIGAKLFPTTLLVLFFTTQATNIPKGYFDQNPKPNPKPPPELISPKSQYEATKIWTLQSTSQIQVEDPDMCVALGTELIHQFDHIGTITVRAYCMCPRAESSRDVCHDKQEEIRALQANEPRPAAIGTIIQLGPDPNNPVSSSTSLRHQPPSR